MQMTGGSKPFMRHIASILGCIVVLAMCASHDATLRALDLKWVRIVFCGWFDRRPYDGFPYLSSQQKRSLPVPRFAVACSP